MTNELERLAAALPAEYEGAWIARLIPSFVHARTRGDSAAEADYFEEAVLAATEALHKAEEKSVTGPLRTAFVKRAVRSRLTDLNRRHDCRGRFLASAEDLTRDEDDDGSARLIEERFAESAFDRLPRHLTDEIALSLLLLDPGTHRIWRAFRETNGSSREIAAHLGNCGKSFVHDRLLPRLFRDFSNCLRTVRHLRGKVF